MSEEWPVRYKEKQERVDRGEEEGVSGRMELLLLLIAATISSNLGPQKCLLASVV